MAAAAKTVAKAAKRKASGKAAKYRGVVSRKDISVADPDLLVIVDTPGHPLYQPARNQKPLDEAMIRSIMQDGVLSPIKVVRGPQVRGQWTLEVVYGRQRVRNAREANRRLVAEGRPPIMIEIVIIDASPEQLRRMMEVENTHRTDYTPYELATTASESLNRGVSEESVCYTSFKGDKASMRRHLALLRCHPDVQRALIEGAINFKAIDSLVKLSLEEQAAEVSKLQAAGLSGPREVRARLIEDHPDMSPTNPADEADEPEEEEAPKAKPVRARNAGEMAARLEALESLPEPNEDDEGADAELVWAIRSARIEELRWALRDDDALATVSKNDRGGWEKPKSVKEEKAAERAAKKEAEKVEKAAAKQQAKADKLAAREAEKQAAKDAKAAAKAKAEAADAKKQTKRGSKAAPKQVTLDEVAPKVPNRGGAGRKAHGK